MNDDLKEDSYINEEANSDIATDSGEETSYINEEANSDVAADSEEETGKKKINIMNEILSWILVFVSAFVLAYVITNYVIVKAEVPTGSMENTIIPNDRIIGNRLAYLFSEPKRGDIIIFKFPDNEEENYVKRIIGLPGDHIVIQGGHIYINGSEEPLLEPYLKEEMINNREYPPYDVPSNSYFVLGDNRNMSKDARAWENTYVEKSKIIGKVWFRYSPSLGFIK